MDLYDKKILKLLIENCRYPICDIAKAVKLSKDSVKYRIEKLERNGVINSYNVMFDPRVFGYFVNQILLRLKNLGREMDKILEKLKKNKNITFISSQSGSYDLQVIFYSKNLFEKNKILEEIFEIFKDKIRDYKEIVQIKDYTFSFLFSDVDVNIKVKDKNNSSFSKQVLENKNSTFFEAKIESFDLIDKKIIKELIKNPREKLQVIGQEVGMSGESVKKRINSIIEKKAIYGFQLYPDYNKLGLFNYMLLFKVKPFSLETEKKLNSFFKSSNFILYSGLVSGSYNFIVYILAKNPLEFQKHFDSLKEIIDENIIDYDLSMLCEVHKFKLIFGRFFEEE